MTEDKDAEDKVLRQLVEIFLSVTITVVRFIVAFILYDVVITNVLGSPPVTVWQAVGIWLFIKCVFGFR